MLQLASKLASLVSTVGVQVGVGLGCSSGASERKPPAPGAGAQGHRAFDGCKPPAFGRRVWIPLPRPASQWRPVPGHCAPPTGCLEGPFACRTRLGSDPAALLILSVAASACKWASAMSRPWPNSTFAQPTAPIPSSHAAHPLHIPPIPHGGGHGGGHGQARHMHPLFSTTFCPSGLLISSIPATMRARWGPETRLRVPRPTRSLFVPRALHLRDIRSSPLLGTETWPCTSCSITPRVPGPRMREC